MTTREQIIAFLNTIPEPNRMSCIKLFNNHKERIDLAPGSKIKHQAWPGGYNGHILETMQIAERMYQILITMHPLPFVLSDALLVLFLHDLEKPFKYIEPVTRFTNDKEKHDFVHSFIHEYNIVLTEEHKNALTYIHGEGNEHNSHTRIQGPLAAFVHCCDTMSARIWFDYPKR